MFLQSLDMLLAKILKRQVWGTNSIFFLHFLTVKQVKIYKSTCITKSHGLLLPVCSPLQYKVDSFQGAHMHVEILKM